VQPLLQWKSNMYYIFRVCIWSLRYPACNAHAPYCHLWSVRLYNIFLHYLKNDTIFGRKLLNTKCVFLFSLQFLSETFFILRRNERDIIKNVYWSSCKVSAIIVRLKYGLNFLDRFSKNTQISNFMKIRPVGNELFHANGRTDIQTDISKVMVAFQQFCDRD
jgi:hypothetical protein